METPTAVGVQRATAHRAALSESEWRMNRTGFISPFFYFYWCKSLDTVRRGRTQGTFSCPLGNSSCVAPAESRPHV